MLYTHWWGQSASLACSHSVGGSAVLAGALLSPVGPSDLRVGPGLPRLLPPHRSKTSWLQEFLTYWF